MKTFTQIVAAALCLMAVACGQPSKNKDTEPADQSKQTVDAAGNYISQRPAEADRLFRSEAVEAKINEVAALLQNPKLRWMFVNCFPNTLDTTVHFRDGETPETFVYTGDIHAMWLRDSGAQVWPYVQLAGGDEYLRRMLAGVINTQLRLITIDPYANAFNDGPTGEGAKDETWPTTIGRRPETPPFSGRPG